MLRVIRRKQGKVVRGLLLVSGLYFLLQVLLSPARTAHDHEIDLDSEVHDRVISHRILGVARMLIRNTSMLNRVERILDGREDNLDRLLRVKEVEKSLDKEAEEENYREKRKRMLKQKLMQDVPVPPVVEGDNPDSPGYGGRGLVIDKDALSPAERAKYDLGYEKFKVNEYASSLIPITRKLKNVTEPECLAKIATYDLSKLPRAGVVVVFHNEAWSILLRTTHSILGASPARLLTEVVLVDDASTMEHLDKPLEDYVARLDRVKLVRLKERSGLMKARMAGFGHVTGKVAAFLDSHCEVPEGWLEPLLQRIHEDENILAVPGTDTIDTQTFQYKVTHASKQMRGGMDLDLLFMWIPQLPEDNERRGSLFEPMKSPAHLGCCFAMSKKTFLRLGLYDPGLKIWGGENTELSFKTWMCGGSVEIIPCSHAGHMFRATSQIGLGNDGDVIIKNCLRVAEVWMDEYKVLYHDRIFNQQDNFDFGDVSDRKALRERLGCKSFGWYLKHAYPDLYIPAHGHASGQVRNKERSNFCVHTRVHWQNHWQPVYAAPCHKRDFIQHFTLTKENQIRRDEGCLNRHPDSHQLIVRACADIANEPGWKYTENDELLHVSSGACLQLEADDKTLVVSPCDGSSRQKWTWERRSLKLPLPS